METSHTHPSLRSGLRIIEVVASTNGPVRLSEIARKIGLSRSTAFHLLHALVDFNYLTQDENERTYSLAPKLYRLTEPNWTKEQLAEIAKPFLEELRRLTGEGTSVAIINDGVVTIVATCASEGPVRVVQEVGATRPVYCTAAGKLLAAWLPKKELDAIINRTVFEKMTPKTNTSPTEFRNELVQIRKTRIAIDNEEYIKGIRCISSPVRDHSGEVRAALCVVGPKNNMPQRQMTKIRQALSDVSDDFSKRLGYGQIDKS